MHVRNVGCCTKVKNVFCYCISNSRWFIFVKIYTDVKNVPPPVSKNPKAERSCSDVAETKLLD